MENIANGGSGSRPMKKKNCFFFVQYGTCSFGNSCRYNHPPREDSSIVQNERTENLFAKYKKKKACKFYRAGTCKYGNYCAYSHSMPVPPLQFNSAGLPMRWDVQACPFYIKNSWCGYGLGCKFHHPEIVIPQVPGYETALHEFLTEDII